MKHYLMAAGIRFPRWLGLIVCQIIPHRWLGNSDNNWRWCSRCKKEERRARNQIWSDE